MKSKIYTDAELESKVLDWLRFPMIVLVVYIHYWGENITGNYGVGNQIYDSIRIFMCHVISRAAVPTFFLISGYYFFFRIENFKFGICKEKLKKRIKTILIPYLLWNLIAIGIVLARKVGAFLVKGKPLNSICTYFEEQGWIDLFWSCNEWVGRTNWLGDTITNSGPALIPMWYLRDLMVFFILTPLIYWLVKKMKIAFLMILFFCYVSDIWPQIMDFHQICFSLS